MGAEITIKLAPAPNSPTADFLATTTLVPSTTTAATALSFNPEEDLPTNIKLDNYTRDAAWCKAACGKKDDEQKWQGIWLKSIDGRGKLPGFLKFLSGRKKSCYGKFESPHPDEATGATINGVFLVPYDQAAAPSSDDGSLNKSDCIYIKYCLNEKDVPGLSKPAMAPPMQRQQQRRAAPPPKATQNQNNTRPPQQQQQQQQQQTKPKKSGLLGGILSAPPPKRQPQPNKQQQNPNNKKTMTSFQVISNFRNKIEQELLDFSNVKDKTCHKLNVSLSKSGVNELSDIDKAKVSMKVFEFIVHEQAEEIGMDKWISIKEPGEFTDEAIFAVYKEGCAPADVLEDLMKGDLPDEVKQQQRAVREEMSKTEARKNKAIQEENLRNATRDDALENSNVDGLKSLNKTKRDRRSIEEIQRGIDTENKRPRGI